MKSKANCIDRKTANSNHANVFIQLLSLLLVACCMLGLTSCSFNPFGLFSRANTDISVNNAKEFLTQKYGMSFEADKIGNRYNTGTSSLIMHPTSDPELFFDVTVNNAQKTCTDNLMKRIIGKKVSDELCQLLASNRVTAYSSMHIMSNDDSAESNTSITVNDYFSKYSVTGVLSYMIVEDKGSETTQSLIKDVCNSIHLKYGINVAVSCYFITENYLECKEAMIKNPDVNESWFYKYHVESALDYAAK